MKKLNVIYVEDDEADVDFVRSALSATSSEGFNITVLEDGEQAVNFFKQNGDSNGFIAPHLVFLDLNLPKVSGFSVLKHIKASDHFKEIPVVVLSTSQVVADVKEAYRIGANGFVTKPANFDGYKETMKRIHDYWLKACVLPGSGKEG